jgi:superkiller protein 3
LRLAVYQQSRQQHEEAVISFQNTLKADPKDPLCWQGLAETYRRQGKFTAALKGFTRAVELDPTLTYSQYQVANIQQLLGFDNDSIEQYKTLLSRNPNYLPALKGLGETYLLLAKEQLKSGVFGKTEESLQHAIEAFEQCTKLQVIFIIQVKIELEILSSG